MTVSQLARVIGKKADLYGSATKLYFQVEILDVKTAYGNELYLVKPVSGNGEQWVSGERIKILEGTDMYQRDKVIELLETLTVLTDDERNYGLNELLKIGDKCAETSGVPFKVFYERRYGFEKS